jgi:isopenicillin N synthase-like dioxygenase
MPAQPPVISLRGLVDDAPSALERVARDLRDPCRDWGVFSIVDHGIPDAVIERFDSAMRRFFSLSIEDKSAVLRSRDNARGYYDRELTKNRPDWKEVFDYGGERAARTADAAHSDGTNQWPAAAPEIREPLLDYYDANEKLCLALLRAMCLGLELRPDALDAAFERHTSFVRLNHYPRCPEPARGDAPLFPEHGGFGVHHHTDAGALTTVYQDDVAGLQAEHEGEFVTLEPVPGALYVNLGDLLQVCSNDRYKAPLHRVAVYADRERFSAPFFLNPSYDTTYQPIPEALAPGEAPRYRPISWSHFRDQRSAGDYADYGDEIQISDYRVQAT